MYADRFGAATCNERRIIVRRLECPEVAMQNVGHCKCVLILASLVFVASALTAQEAFGQVFDEKAWKKHDADVERAVKEAHAKSLDKAVENLRKAEAERENHFLEIWRDVRSTLFYFALSAFVVGLIVLFVYDRVRRARAGRSLKQSDSPDPK
jgi:hypothetical protein